MIFHLIVPMLADEQGTSTKKISQNHYGVWIASGVLIEKAMLTVKSWDDSPWQLP